MPQYRCNACRVQHQSSEGPVGGAGELCPVCGSLLEALHTLSELTVPRAGEPGLVATAPVAGRDR
jgi:hypothetical protein